MHTSVSELDSRTDDGGFERLTSPTVGAVLGSIAIAATVATPLLYGIGTLSGLLIMGVAAVAMALSNIGLQLQAAILLLRDGRWPMAALSAAICTMCLAALYLVAFHFPAGWFLVSASAAAAAVYAHEL